MIRPPDPAIVGTALTAETVVLVLCRVLLGGGERDKHGKLKDRGLMNHFVNGTRHLQSCQIGMYIEADDCMRGGQPCSDRCQRAHDAISMAGQGLKAHEGSEQGEARPVQPRLWDQEAV